MQTVVIPRGLRIERLRTDRGGGGIRQGISKSTALTRGIFTSLPPPPLPNKTGDQKEVGEQLPTSHAVYLKMRDSRNTFGEECFSWQRILPTVCRRPHSALQSQAPFTVLLDVPAKLDHLRKIGARALSYTSKHTRQRSRTRPGEVDSVGYSMNSKEYRIYSNLTERVTEGRDVIFIDTPASTLADSTQAVTQAVLMKTARR